MQCDRWRDVACVFHRIQWHDCDDIAHIWGPSINEMYLTVTDERGNILYDNFKFEQLKNVGIKYDEEEEVYTDQQPEGTVVFVGQSIEEGLFYSIDVEATGLDNRIYPDEYFEDGIKTRNGIRTISRVVGIL